MTKHVVKSPGMSRQPWLDIVSYGRRGHRRPDRFTPAQLQHIALIVRRAPEVIVKVSGGGKSIGAVAAHAKYIGRHGKVEILTDDGDRLAGREAAKNLTEDWDLENQEGQYGNKARGRRDRLAPKLVHNIVLSMPRFTDPERLVRAASAFARENFALSHRYAYVLHTDTEYPHVHLVVKAASEQGERLHITKATLRDWRETFAAQLRAQGVPAAATPAPLRGRASGHVSDGAYRMAARGQRLKSIERASGAREATRRHTLRQLAARQPAATSSRIINSDWSATLATLRTQGATALASEVMAYIASMKKKVQVEEPIKEPTKQGNEHAR